MKRHEMLMLALIIVLTAMLRLVGLNTLPPPLNPDEASRGYDAWSLLETGMDRHGERWPAFLRSFGPGDYTGALSAYLMIPGIAVLGPIPLAIRLPNAALGVATVAALWWLVRRAVDSHAALIAALLLAVCPWHLRMCRVGHEAGLVPFFMTLGAALLFSGMAVTTRSATGDSAWRYARMFAAGLCWGLAAWTYPAARVVIPLLALMTVLLFFVRRDQAAAVRSGGEPTPSGHASNADGPVWLGRSTHAGAFIVGLLIGAMPILWSMIVNPERIAARANATLVMADKSLSTGDKLAAMARNYGQEISPDVLFFRSDDMTAQRLIGYGRLLHVEAPFVVVGLLVLARQCMRGTSPAPAFLLLWLFLAPVPAALCKGWNPHPLRGIMAVPAWSIVSAIGIVATLSWCATRLKTQSARWPVAVVITAILLDAGVVGRRYFEEYPVVAADHFQENIVRAVEWLRNNPQVHDRVWVTEYANQAYIYVLLYWPVPPRAFHQFQREGLVQTTPWFEDFEHVVRMGTFVFNRAFNPVVPLSVTAQAAIRQAVSEWPAGTRAVVVDVPGNGPPGRIIHSFKRRMGGMGIEIRELSR